MEHHKASQSHDNVKQISRRGQNNQLESLGNGLERKIVWENISIQGDWIEHWASSLCSNKTTKFDDKCL